MGGGEVETINFLQQIKKLTWNYSMGPSREQQVIKCLYEVNGEYCNGIVKVSG